MLRNAMRAQGLDAMLVSLPAGIRYLSGFTGSYGLLLVTLRNAWCLTDSRYRLQARTELRGFRPLTVRSGFGDSIRQHSLLRGCRTVGYDEGHLTVAEHRSLRRHCAPCALTPAGALLPPLMSRKDSAELSLLCHAVDITDNVFCDIIKLIRPGVAERDLAAEISYRQRKEGADGDAFDAIVASGPRSASPHARASAKKIRNGEVVVLDFGCVVEGYHSDLTRTVGVGRVSRLLRDQYHTVLRAQETGIEALRAGRPARDVDALVRGQLASEGFRKFFPHSLGHGVGLRIHESPRLAPYSRDMLAPGNVVTVEPGVYIPGRGGIRIEDVVLVTENGRRVLSAAPRELMIL